MELWLAMAEKELATKVKLTASFYPSILYYSESGLDLERVHESACLFSYSENFQHLGVLTRFFHVGPTSLEQPWHKSLCWAYILVLPVRS